MDIEITFGMMCKDQITGFESIVTGECSYITGCKQLLLTPKIKSDGTWNEPRWFDKDRLQITVANPIVLDAQTNPGPDMAAPIK